MAKGKIFLFTCWLLVTLLWSCPPGWSETPNPGELEEKLRRAEDNYSEENYSTAKDIFVSLYRSFPLDPRFSYIQFMIAKCDYHLRNYGFASDRFKEFISRFPQSKFTPACHYLLGNIAYLLGATFESAQSFIDAHRLAKTGRLKGLAKRSLQPLLQKQLSEADLERLGTENKEEELTPEIFFHLGRRNFERANFREAFKALAYYRDNFPDGERTEEVYLLLQELSFSPTGTVKVGVLAPLTGDLSIYGTNLLSGINLAVSSYPSVERKVQLEIRDTQGDFVKAALLCQELVEEENVVSVIGPLRSESAAAAAVVAQYAKIPLITPTASKEGLASLGDFVFQLSPSPRNKGRNLAEFAVRDEKLKEFIMLSPKEEQAEPEALAFKEAVEQLGGKMLAVEYYPPGTQDFSPHLRVLKNVLLGFPPTAPQEEEGSFFDEVPVWVDGFFVSADQKELYDILSHIANLNIYSAIIGTEGCGSKQMLEFAQNIDREAIFASNTFRQDNDSLWQPTSERYSDDHRKETDRVSMLGYDSMLLLLSILEKVVSPRNINRALSKTHNFKGASGEIEFDRHGENMSIPIYKLENGSVRRVR